MKYTLSIIFTLLSFSIIAQSGFKYQTVVRDALGEVAANQTVKFRMGIAQVDMNSTPVYQEIHEVTTNLYGVANLVIGEGGVATGDFDNIDWSKTSYLQVELDIAGGSNYLMMGVSELLAVPKAKYAEQAGRSGCGGMGLCVLDYGAIGDNTTDDTAAFQSALDDAEAKGQRVIVPAGNYKITTTLEVPRGVMIVGEGTGATALGTPFNGSAIRYDGTGAAVQFSGDNSGMRDMLVYDDNQGSTNANGIHVLADGEGVESLRFFNVLIHYFIGGTALHIEAVNGGGIAYGTYYNIRIRNAKVGIHIEEDAPSFNNSNQWNHGTISGGGYENCLLVDGGNNNQFYGTIIEPFESTMGHIVVNEGEIQCHDIRIEAQTQPATIPVVKFAAGTYNSYMDGLFAHGTIEDKGNNHIAFRAQKATFYADPQSNLYENSSFYGFENGVLPYWDVSEEGGTGTTLEIESPQLNPNDKVLKITVPAGVTAHFEQSELFIQALGSLPKYGRVHFGMYAKTTEANAVFLRNNAPNGVVSSGFHPGDADWHFIGMTALVNTNVTMDARLSIVNTTGADLVVYLSSPTMNFGNQIADGAAKPISSAGGIVTGTLTTSMIEFTPTTNFIVLPKEANVFVMNGTQSILRINHSGADKFPKGTIITLLFNDAGMGVASSVYINLKGGFTSVANASLTLIANGNGTWRELSRNL